MYTISKEFAFEAAHHLPDLPDGHKCRNPHGHSYRVIIELRLPGLNEYGFVVDYGELSQLKDYLDRELDHHDLNEVFSFQTTAENIAHHLYDYCKNIWPATYRVGVSETAKTWAWYMVQWGN